MHRYAALFALISTVLCGQSVLDQGIAAFDSGKYQQALELLKKSEEIHPDEAAAHAYVGRIYMATWSPANDANLRLARVELTRALQLDPNEKIALETMADIALFEAGQLEGEQKARKIDEGLSWFERLVAVDPANKKMHCMIGAVAFAKCHLALVKARASVSMKPDDPGRLPDTVRLELKAKFSPIIQEGIDHLEKALALDPNYPDAMGFLSLLTGSRATLRDTQEQYVADLAIADEWTQKEKQASVAPPPRVQAAEIVKQVTPVYPPLAKQARISGPVKFTLIITKDGTVRDVRLLSGHPLLVQAAMDAVKQYVYVPVLLNGMPVEAVTEAIVNFNLN